VNHRSDEDAPIPAIRGTKVQPIRLNGG